MTAKTIVNTLCATRHKDDLCVPECKDGPSMGTRSSRLDLWAMRRSYSKFATFGYEVKVSRGDFLKDEKWQNYLPLCHQFFFVTPWKLVDPAEIPGGCGLLWASKNLSSVRIKKKAQHRDIDLPEGLVTYILMSRAKIVDREIDVGDDEEKITHIRHWLDSNKELKDLGYRVALRTKQEVDAAHRKVKDMEQEVESLKHIRDFWTNILGCNENKLRSRYMFELQRSNKNAQQKLQTIIPEDLQSEIRKATEIAEKFGDLSKSLQNILDTVENNKNI
mgnify:CR=1 FL=1